MMISSQQQPIQTQQQHQQVNSFQRYPINSVHRPMNGQTQSSNSQNQAQNQILQQKNLHQNQAQPNKRIKTIKKPSLMARNGRNVVDERKNSFPTQTSESQKYTSSNGQQVQNGINRGNNNPVVSQVSTSQTSCLSTNNTLILGNNQSNNMNLNQNQIRRASNNINGQVNKHFEKKHIYDKKINQIGNCQVGNPQNNIYQGVSQLCVQCGQNGCGNVCGLSIVGQQIQNGGNGIQGNINNIVPNNQAQDSQRMRFQASAQNILNQSGVQRIQVNGSLNSNQNNTSQSSSSCFYNQQQGNIQNRQNSNQASTHSTNSFLENSQPQQTPHNTSNQNNSQRHQKISNSVINGRNNNIRNIPIQEIININQNQIQLNNHMQYNNSNRDSQFPTLTLSSNDQFNHLSESPQQILASNRHQRVRQAAAQQIENTNSIRGNSNNSNNQNTVRIRNPLNVRSFSNKNNNINQGQNRINGNQNQQGLQNDQSQQYSGLQIVGISTEGNQHGNSYNQNRQSQQSNNNFAFRNSSQHNQNIQNNQYHQQNNNNQNQRHHTQHYSNIRRNSMQPNSNGQNQQNNIQYNQNNNNSASNLNGHNRSNHQQPRYRITGRPSHAQNQGNFQVQQNRPSQPESLSESLNELSFYQNGQSSQESANIYNQYMNQTGMSHIQMVNNEYLNLNSNSLAQSTTSDFFGYSNNGYNQFLNSLNQSIIERYNYDFDNQNNNEDVDMEEDEYNDDDNNIQDIEEFDDQNENEEQKLEEYEDYRNLCDRNFMELNRIVNIPANQLNFVNQIHSINSRQLNGNNHHNHNNQNQNNNSSRIVIRRVMDNQQQINQPQIQTLNSQTQSTNNNSNYGYDQYSNADNFSYNQSSVSHFLPSIFLPNNQSNQQNNMPRRQYQRNQHAEPHRILRQNGRKNRRRWNQQLGRNQNQGSQNQQEQFQESQQRNASNSNLNHMQADIEQQSNNNIQNSFVGYQPDFLYYQDETDSDQESFSFGGAGEEEEEKQSFERYNMNSNIYDNGYLFQQYQEEDSQDQQEESYDQNYMQNIEFPNNFEEDIGSYGNEDEDDDENQEEDDENGNDDDEEDEGEDNQSQVFENNLNITFQINSPNEINFNVNQINIDIDNQMYENASQISLPDPRFFDEFARNLMRDILNRHELNSLISRHIYSFQIDSEALQLQEEESNQVPGMNQDEIDKMKTTFHTSSKTHKTCAICLSDFEEGEKVKELNCEHRFHIPCVDDWLKIKGSCPLCRQNLAQGNAEQQNEENLDLQVNISY